MGVLLSFLGSAVAKVFTDKVLAYLAMKAILVFLFIVVVPLLLNNFVYDLIEIVMNFANNQAGSAGSMNGAMNFTGFAGWLVSSFRLPECLSVMVSALVLRLSLSMVPFVRL